MKSLEQLCVSLAVFSQVSEQQLQGKQWVAEEGFCYP